MHKWGYTSPKIESHAENEKKKWQKSYLAMTQTAQNCIEWNFTWKQGNIAGLQAGCVILCTYPGDLLVAPSDVLPAPQAQAHP